MSAVASFPCHDHVRVRMRRFGGLSDQRTANLGIPRESK